MKQTTFASLAWSNKGKVTRRERFLAEMDDESTILRFRHLLEAHQLTRIRARVEHPFNVVKRLWGFTKVRYHGIGKNLAKAYSMFALANLYLVRRRLMPPGAKCAL
jgi:IS5 family transposase